MQSNIPPDCRAELRALIDAACIGKLSREGFLSNCAVLLQIGMGMQWPPCVHLTLHFLEDQDLVACDPDYGHAAYARIIRALEKGCTG